MAAWVDPEQVKRSRTYVNKAVKEKIAPWLTGEVRRHCSRCEAEVGREDRNCHSCGAPLKKECPRCHYWVELDTTFCVSCRHAFPLPPLSKATVKLWHAIEAECKESVMVIEERTIGSGCPEPSAQDG